MENDILELQKLDPLMRKQAQKSKALQELRIMKDSTYSNTG